MKTKILYWTQLFWPYIGGVEVLGAQFLPVMAARGYEPTVITSHGSLDLPDLDEYSGIPIHRFHFQEAFETRDLDLMFQIQKQVAGLKRSTQPDLVHINLTDPGLWFHWRTQSAYPAPTLIALRLALDLIQTGADSLFGQSLRQARWITANSEAILAGLHELAPETKPYSSVIYNGLKTPDSALLPLPLDPPRLLCFGRVVPEKGFDLAIRALPEVLSVHPTAALSIAGDGPARPELENLAAELGVRDQVAFLGWVRPEEIPPLLNRSTCVLIPSRWQEAFGLVALQAAQMARPVIATRTGGLPEVVLDGETGFLVEREDPGALAQAIVTLLADPEMMKKLGDSAREHVFKNFSWDAYLEAHDQLYQKIIQGVTE